MRKLLIILALLSFVSAKDNFIYEAYEPTAIENRLQSIEKELKILRQYVSVQKNGKVVVKTTTTSKRGTQEELKDLKRVVVTLQRKVNSMEKTKGAASSKYLSQKISVLDKKISDIESKLSGKDGKLNAVMSPKHDSMRIDILDEKISNIDKKINRLQIDVESSSASVDVDSLLKNPMVQYVLIGVSVVLLLIFAMVLSAMSRAKEAISRANRVAEAVAKTKEKKEVPPKETAPKEEKSKESNDDEGVVLKTD